MRVRRRRPARRSSRQQRRVGASLDWGRLRFTMDDGLGQGRPDRLHPALPRRPGLPDRGAHQLVPGLPDERSATSRSSRRPRRARSGRSATTSSTRRGRRRPGRHDRRRDDPARDDPRRHRGRRPSRRPALSGARRSDRRVIPFVDRPVPIIADPVVEREFGTGAVKITPAHDHDDYATGRRHGLPMITVLDDDARINESGRPVRRPRPVRGAARGSWPTSRRAATSSRRSRTR